MGRTPMIAPCIREFVPIDQMVTYAEACLRVYNRHGRRDNKYKARIKILVHELGAEEYTPPGRGGVRAPARAEHRAPCRRTGPHRRILRRPAFEAGAPRRTSTAPTPTSRCGSIRNTHPHKAPGYVSAVISLKPVGGIPGDATADQMRLMADLAERYSASTSCASRTRRTSSCRTCARPISTRCGPRSTTPGWAPPTSTWSGDIIACPGLDYCSLANARSIPVAQKISRALRRPQAARPRRAEDQDLGLHQRLRPPPRGPHRHPRRRPEGHRELPAAARRSEAEDTSLGQDRRPGLRRGGHRRRGRERDRASTSRAARTASASSTPTAASAWNRSRRRSMAEAAQPPSPALLRFRDDDAVDDPAVTLDAFLDQSNAAAVRIEPGDDARALLPHLAGLRLVEVELPRLPRRARLFRRAHPARGGLHRRDARGGRRAGRPVVLHAPLRLRQLRARQAARPRRCRGRAEPVGRTSISPPPTGATPIWELRHG